MASERSSVRRILKRWGPEISENLRRATEIVPSKISPIFRPKLGEEQKQKKRSTLIFGPIFRPELGEEQKKRSSLKFGPIFHRNVNASPNETHQRLPFV